MSDLVEKTRHFRVDPLQKPLRIDLFLVRLNPDLTRSYLQKLIEDGQVTLEGRPVRASEKVHSGQRIRLKIPPPVVLKAEAEAIPLKVLYEDKHLAVVDKPAELIVHAAGKKSQGTLVNALLYHLKDLSGIGGSLRPGIVHRLDKGTSGLMVVAKTNEAHLALSRMFQEHQIEKTYLALAYGSFKADEGIIEGRIGRSRGNRKKFSSRTRKGREAKTRYRVLHRFENVALLEVKPYTGRTHQIRVHLSEAGHPLVGDPLYGGRQWIQKLPPKLQKGVQALGRQALHAWKLRFEHPLKKKELKLEAEIPQDLEEILQELRRYSS